MSHDSDSDSSSKEDIDFDYKKNVDKGTMGLLRDENREDFGNSLLNSNEDEVSSEDEEKDDSPDEVDDSKPLPTIYARMKDPNSDFRFDSEEEEDSHDDEGKQEYLVFDDEQASVVVTDQNPYSLIAPSVATAAEEIDASLYFPADDDFGKDFEFPSLGLAKDTKPFLSHDVPLPDEHVDNIKNIMKNIKLANVPKWANFDDNK